MKLEIKYILPIYLFILFAGTIFFIPAIFVSRFTTAPALWMQIGVNIGIIGYIFLTKERITLPPLNFILLLSIWAIYHIWHNYGNIEKVITVITLIGTFFLFYSIWRYLKDKKFLFILFSFSAIILSLWGLGQFFGLLPSYNTSFIITGPFDNPAGISASLAVLLPFPLYCYRYSEKKYRIFAITTICLVITVIVLSKARTAILATIIVLIFFLIRLFKERNLKLSPVHYTAIFIGCMLFVTGLFFIKKDSANGRLLIWRCSAQLISYKPVLGHGGNGFTANYMNEQASYFTKNPDSKYVMIADNVRHPFNEILKWTVNYGTVGLTLTLLLIIIPLWISWKKDSPRMFFIRLSLLSIGICALFSYPFSYPFVQLMMVVLLAFMSADRPQKNILVMNANLPKGIALLFAIGLLSCTVYQFFHEREWHKIAYKSLRGQTIQMLPRYKSLYPHLRHKDLFLYNYASTLNIVGCYETSQQIAQECDNLWADYDLQMLMADNCQKLQQYVEAENYLKQALSMCPAKFMPLYNLVDLYLETGRKEEMEILAQTILNKSVKVPSLLINSIKSKMRKLLNKPDKSNDLDKELVISLSWQDCFLDFRTPRALLPT